eukprot:149936-Pelagomonas_calceolata.AAC.14
MKACPTSIKEKRITRAKAPCIPSTKRKKNQWGSGGCHFAQFFLLAFCNPVLYTVPQQLRIMAMGVQRVFQTFKALIVASELSPYVTVEYAAEQNK